MDNIIIFGGSGFIGRHFVKFLIDNHYTTKIYICDIKDTELKNIAKYRDSIEYIYLDVREQIEEKMLDSRLIGDDNCVKLAGNIDLIVNLAAIHREPGHKPYEYFETNIKGAENVCEFARKVNCKNIIFTSSISPYGPSEEEKTENSLPTPATAYGSSKLVAEKIHQAWQMEDQTRKLIIVRPGVIFGPGEVGGNVQRLIKALKYHYFFYMGNRNVQKAGGYVKELCHAMWWGLNQIEKGILLFNFSFEKPPTVEEYVTTICNVLNIKRSVISINYIPFLLLSYLINFLSKIFKIKQPIHPARIQKLKRSNKIIPQVMIERKYKYQYTLESALEDWKKERPRDFA